MIQFKCLNCGTRLVISSFPVRITLSCNICGGVDFQSLCEKDVKMSPVIEGNESGRLCVLGHKDMISGQGSFGRIWDIDWASPEEKKDLAPTEEDELKKIGNAILGNSPEKPKGKKNVKGDM